MFARLEYGNHSSLLKFRLQICPFLTNAFFYVDVFEFLVLFESGSVYLNHQIESERRLCLAQRQCSIALFGSHNCEHQLSTEKPVENLCANPSVHDNLCKLGVLLGLGTAFNYCLIDCLLI